jgi:hypothetical protein
MKIFKKTNLVSSVSWMNLAWGANEEACLAWTRDVFWSEDWSRSWISFE